jgi:hypothetical protein
MSRGHHEGMVEDDADEARREEAAARERLRETEAEAKETLEEAERLEDEASEPSDD